MYILTPKVIVNMDIEMAAISSGIAPKNMKTPPNITPIIPRIVAKYPNGFRLESKAAAAI